MLYSQLGKTGLSVSKIGFGASPLGAEFGPVDVSEGQRAVDYAIDNGINYFDVAPYYGRTLAEERLGKYLSGKRDKLILATKACRYDITIDGGFDYAGDRVMRSIDESLSRLKTDYIDVYQVHDVEYADRRQLLEETLPAMYKLRDQGKVRFVGITGYPLTPLKEIAECTEIDTILSYCRYNLADTTMDTILTPTAREKGIGLINASPLHMRVLTDTGAPDWHPAPEPVLAAAARAAEVCRAAGTTIADLAMQFALEHDYVATTLVGTSKVKHVDANIKNLDVKPDSELLEKVLGIFEPVKDVFWKEGRPENDDPDAVDKRTLGLERSEDIKK
jgi:L-galactose dehydrogenase